MVQLSGQQPTPRLAAWTCAAPVLLPVAAGLAGTLLLSLGALPGFGQDHSGQVGFGAWRALLAWPGLGRSLWLTLRVGAGATAAALLSAVLLAGLARRAGLLRALSALLPPLLATPHLALAIGFAFLIAPSGWATRLASPWLTGWHAPPDAVVVHDPAGLALIAGLWLKETAYLTLALLAALSQVPVAGARRTAANLGYGPWRAWWLVVLPLAWRQLRLPVMAVLAFSLSVVDVALVLGPGEPPTLAVQVVRWFASPDLADWPAGAAGALLLAALVAACLAALRGLEALARLAAPHVLAAGARGGDGRAADAAAGGLGAALAAVAAAALGLLVLWAGAAFWPFTAALPPGWQAARLAGRLAGLAGAGWTTLALAVASTGLALLLAIASLAAGIRGTRWVFVPLLVPQPAFLWGQQVLLVRLRLDGGWFALIWAHVVFVLPYVLLSLAGPWRALDPRYGRAAAALGAAPWRVLLRVRLPLLARPLLGAFAVGFSVSVALYLPTLFAGAGRFDTFATLAVSLASGPDRAAAAAAALGQAALPLLVFALSVLLPGLRARRRRGLALTA